MSSPDWSRPFEATYRMVRVSRKTGLELGALDNVIEGGSITRNVDASAYESGTVDFVGSLDLGSDLLRVYLDADFFGGGEASVALGTFSVSVPQRTVNGAFAEGSADLSGRLAELADARPTAPVTIAAGADAVAEAARLLAKSGATVLQSQASGYRLAQAWSFGVGTGEDSTDTYLGAANALLDLAGWGSARTDAYGRVVLAPYRAPQDRAPAWSFAEGASARFLAEATDERDLSDVANVVLAVYSNQDETVVGVARDTSETSPTSIANLGWERAAKYEYNDVVSQAEATAKAKELLDNQRNVIRRVKLSHVYAPVTAGDAVDVDYASAGISGRFAVRTQTLDLGAGCLTQAELKRTERWD